MVTNLAKIRDQFFPVDRLFRDIRNDLQANLLQNFITIVILFSLIGAYLLIPQIGAYLSAFMLLILLAIGSFLIKKLSKTHFDWARYAFVSFLLVSLGIGMLAYPSSWVPLLGLPLILVGGLLVSRSILLMAVCIFGFAVLANQSGVMYFPLDILLILLTVTVATTRATLETFYIALSWYGTMHQRADKLLQDARNHRAEVVQTLKSLDISYQTQKRLQQQLVFARQQANEARRMKERFAANISHELRTPLNLILGFSEIMYLTPEVYGDINFPPHFTRDIYQIHRSSKYLLDMIDDVLDLSHIELSGFTLNFERTELSEFLKDTVEILRSLFRDPNVVLIVDFPTTPIYVDIDKTRIRQVLLNLFNNARRFTSSGSITLKVWQDEKLVYFGVKDTGIGIHADKLNLIFDEFYQVDYSLSRSHGGAGLGLAITKRFVEAHHGTIIVESQEGIGSQFTFTLPLLDFQSNQLPYPFEDAVLTQDKPYILLIEGDSAIVSMLQRHLHDYCIVTVDDLSHLEGMIEQFQPRAIINNLSPFNKVHPSLPKTVVPILECTLPSSIWMAEQLGVAACLAKPITPQQLSEQIKRFEPLERILIVDDDLGFVQLVQRSIETLNGNYRLFRAYDGLQAVEMAEQYEPNLIFLDLAMPDMSGFEVIEMLNNNQQLRNIPIVLLTATRYVQSGIEPSTHLHLQKSDGLKPGEILRFLEAIIQQLDHIPHKE